MKYIFDRLLKSIFYRISYLLRLYVRRDPKIVAHRSWMRGNKEYLRYDYELNSESVCLDVGGYRGEWAEAIWKKYDCWVYVYEPVPPFFESIKKKCSGNKKIQPFQFGLSDSDSTAMMSFDENASSAYRMNQNKVPVHFRDIAKVLDEQKLDKVDLIKLNIEGGEYPLLERLIETGKINRIRYIQVQFHDFVDNAVERRQMLHDAMNQTHEMVWCYPFIWESWRRRVEK